MYDMIPWCNKTKHLPIQLTCVLITCVMVKIAPQCTADLLAPVSTGAHIAKAFHLGYASVSSTVLRLQARECLLTLLPIGIAQYVMSNMSSGTSGRWCVQCDDTAYIISGILLSVVPSYK